MLMHRLLRRPALLCSLAALWLTSSAAAAQPGATGVLGATDAKILTVKFLRLSGSPKTTFRLAILGENLPASGASADVQLDTQDPGKPVENQSVVFVNSKEVDISGEAPVGTVITAVKFMVGGKTILSPDGLTVSIKPLQPEPELKELRIKFDHHQSKEFPNLHSVIVTKESGHIGFDINPNHMRVELEPPGATDLRIVQSNEEQLELHFIAAADYEPKNVLITVFNGSDLDRRHAIGVAKLAALAEDPDAPTITKLEPLFVNRSDGVGRIRIYGKNFGIQDTHSFSVDDYLCNCHERLNTYGFRTCGVLGNDHGPRHLTSQVPSPRNDTDYGEGGEKGGPEALQRRVDQRKAFCASLEKEWASYQNKLRGQITVGINSRNIDIRVEKAEVIDANDRMIDIYFEFTRHYGYAWPFQLAGVDLTINKTITKVEQTVRAAEVCGEVDTKASGIFSLSKAIGPDPDRNLAYQYTVLDSKAAMSLLGQGIADNFYVLQLSVVNHGKKKVNIPLAAIQAEVEWLYGYSPNSKAGDGERAEKVQGFYIEGPPTVAPIPLAAVSAYFGTYQKYRGTRTKVFNILDGITTLATALIPFSGPALKDAEVVLSGGFIPGLRQAWPDLLAQQLQNLTSLSWESSETLAAGESTAKYIYIQRKSQFQDPKEPNNDPPRKTFKQISNIMALEVAGFEVSDTTEKQATPVPATTSPTTQADTKPPHP